MRVVWDDVEAGLGSPGRIRILRVLLRKPGERFTRYALERLTGLKPVDVRRNLSVLVSLGWVRENPYDPRTYEVNMDNDVVKIIAEFFRRLPGA
ncbi:MarR family transcriptional regulator [Candidatus Bathyarchaeota archaeon]|nr:MarR family transcriptional regulator [Candidatus Bathyarchaeota archaeon]